MEIRTQRIFLGLAVAATLAVAPVHAQETESEPSSERPLIEPDIEPRPVKEDRIDTENFELSLFTGLVSIEDFETSWLVGARGAYHMTEDFFLEASYGMAEAGESSFERLAGNVQLLPEDDRDYSYYTLAVGYKILPGEAFWSDRYAFNSYFYLVGGGGATDFAGDTQMTYVLGAGYQLLFTDWLAGHLSMRQHMYDIDLVGEEKTNFDLQFSGAVSVFF